MEQVQKEIIEIKSNVNRILYIFEGINYYINGHKSFEGEFKNDYQNG